MNTEKSRTRFVLCIHNQGSEDLEPRKVFQVLPDRAAVREGYMRVIDESGEDYLYPAEYFVPVARPVAITRVPASAASEAVPPKAQKRRRA